jgi:hypothetical protein
MSESILPEAFIEALWQLASWLTESKVPHVTIGGVVSVGNPVKNL